MFEVSPCLTICHLSRGAVPSVPRLEVSPAVSPRRHRCVSSFGDFETSQLDPTRIVYISLVYETCDRCTSEKIFKRPHRAVGSLRWKTEKKNWAMQNEGKVRSTEANALVSQGQKTSCASCPGLDSFTVNKSASIDDCVRR